MRIEPKEIIDGKMNGQYVWICDHRAGDDIANKPIRHVEPQQVLIRSNEETKKRIYYSESHFAPLNTKGLPTSATVGLYDNTGYRAYRGVALQVFDNSQECRTEYVKACKHLITQNMIYQAGVVDTVASRINTLEETIRKQLN